MKKNILILALLLGALPVPAETIKDIRIVNQEGETADSSAVSAYTSFDVGEEVPDRDTVLSSIANDVNRMVDSGRYSYVKAHMEEEEDGIILVYTVTTKPRLVGIRIRGASKVGNKKVKGKSGLMVGQKADDSTFEEAASKIREYYHDHWYPEAEVRWTAERNNELDTAVVTFTVDEGRKLGIKDILFDGNEQIDEDSLRRVMEQKEKRWYSFITRTGQYKPDLTDLDVFSLKSFYMNEGFLDVEVSDPILDPSKPRSARLIYPIREGQRYVIGEVTLSGMEEFTEEELRRTIRLQTGAVASYENIEAVSEALRSFYGNRGYIQASIRPIYHADAQRGIVDIEYAITEGALGYINKINIMGNEQTADKVIRRELVVYPDEKYNRSSVQSSENRLRNLQYFEYVSITPSPTEELAKYDLNVQLKEQPTGRFAAGVGFSSVDSLVGYVELAQGNFSYKRWPPIGDGQKFKIRAQLGTERNDLDISFVEPWFMDRQLSFGIDLYHRESRYYSDVYDQRTDGFRLSLGKPLSRFTRGTLAYSLERFDVFDVAPTATPIIASEEGVRSKSALEYTWLYDSRNHPFTPNRGNKTTISPYIAGGALGGQTDIHGVRVRSAQYWPLVGDMIFNLRGQAESVEAFGDSKDADTLYGDGVPLFDRLFLGGSYTLRGFEYRDVGPKSLTGDPIGGNSSAYATAELTFPIWSPIRGATFYDCGFVNVDSWDFNPSNYNDNWGIGLRLNLPGFPLQFDYAWPITYDDRFQSGDGRFNFLIGHSF